MNMNMNIEFRKATADDSECIGKMIVMLTNEVCELTKTQHFDISLSNTIEACRELIINKHYKVILAFDGQVCIGCVTLSETFALYAGGKIGIIQEFYIFPEYRSANVGSLLVEQVKTLAQKLNWSCIELCTPPLPEFERTLSFYQKNRLKPVGGRKMRFNIS